MSRRLVCIICPAGCVIEIDDQGNIRGAKCDRGVAYAKEEMEMPKRGLTTTMRVVGGEIPLVSVKTSAPIPKKLLFEAMDIIAEREARAPVGIGDLLIKDIAGTGSDIIATKNVEASGENKQ